MLIWIASGLLFLLPAGMKEQPEGTGPQSSASQPVSEGRSRSEAERTYVLGPEDQIEVSAPEGELSARGVRVDGGGYIRLPLLGRVRAGGLTVEQLEGDLAQRLKKYMHEPDVTVTIMEFRSRPVSVIGAVKNPGVHHLQGQKTLVEVLALAGGLDQTAGSAIKITRRLQAGRIPLKSATDDATGQFSVAQVSVKNLLEAANPEENIGVQAFDVVSVPRAEMVYVTGQVVRSGGFVLNERENTTVLKALSLAGGLDRAAAPQHARILRKSSSDAARTEIPVDLRRILQGMKEDTAMRPEDILFVPSSAPKKAALRAAEAAIQLGTGVVIWRR